jgi:hypothetical protein
MCQGKIDKTEEWHTPRTVRSTIDADRYTSSNQNHHQPEVAQIHKQTAIVQQEQKRSLDDRLMESKVFTAFNILTKTAFISW